MRRSIAPGGVLVVKIGSSSLVEVEKGLDPAALERVVGHVTRALDSGYPTVLVTSGAVAAGLPALGLTDRPTDLAGLQVAAAVGQGRLMGMYAARFARRGLVAGQVLLTRGVLASRTPYLNARTALSSMLERRIVPVVNENDTVGVEELRVGDNDRLAALVSHLVSADLLILLTDTPGLYSADPSSPDARLISEISSGDWTLDSIASLPGGRLGSGGVSSKGGGGPDGGLFRYPDRGCPFFRAPGGGAGMPGRRHRDLGEPGSPETQCTQALDSVRPGVGGVG